MQIKQVILETSKLDELNHFYSSVLELPTEILTEEIKIKTGSTELVFRQAKAAGSFYHFAINIPANKIEEAKTWMKNRVDLLWINDYSSDIADFATWHAKSIYFYDPAGNILELIARFDLNNTNNHPFSSSQFLSVSEVGLVFNENELEMKTSGLLQQYHLGYFDKQPPLPQFKAVGDDEGLFIIVTANRNWYPTTKPSAISPITVLFENKGAEYKLETGK